MVRESNLTGGQILCTPPDSSWGPLASLKWIPGLFPGDKMTGEWRSTHLHPVPRFKKD